MPYVATQGLGDALLVPAGCAHQVRNVRSCIKVALDFVAPEHVGHCVRLTEELRQLPAAHCRRTDVLNIRAILFFSMCACLATVDEGNGKARKGDKARREGGARAPPHPAPPPPPTLPPPPVPPPSDAQQPPSAIAAEVAAALMLPEAF